MFRFLPPYRWQEEALQLCEHWFLLKSCTSQGQGAQALPQDLSQESVAISHNGQCPGTHQNCKRSLCITPPLIRNLTEKLNNLTNSKELTLSEIRPDSVAHVDFSLSLYVMQAFWKALRYKSWPGRGAQASHVK